MSASSSPPILLHPALGVPVGGRRIAVDGAEVPLPVDERVAHREVLGQAHQGVVGGRVAVRVELARAPRRRRART